MSNNIENNHNNNNNNNNDQKSNEVAIDESMLLANRKKALEKEIDDINRLIQKKERLPDAPTNHWYQSYPLIDKTVSHPDFDVWRINTILMGFSGLAMGGIIGYSDGLQAIKDQLKRASHNPLSASEFQMNGRKILGQSVFRTSLIYSYRLSLYTGLFLGTDLLLKNNVIGDKPLINRTIAGCTVGILAGYHIRHRAGPNSILLGSILGSGIGFLSGAMDIGISKIFDSGDSDQKRKDISQL
ncbi:hypothetical protein PPL_06324 [Heterostelium album PN500]|uniref:Uncharacterized protein n=1 Tax=Heterostelium pallidum (strain ATCC 26659 / Pp 5 / PN500) TaxID=670386 RepID=D3BCU6_HETP5|nr:hypothetical protein PPL_06324 [Heterostelium album PN500]EFA80738.1 hypothetical protein PPL_06324 [Heterostelium album PN500]|eukprot:XP_020432858.1 hypothetical protein PPL_06324 [Heterostelium album PN500]